MRSHIESCNQSGLTVSNYCEQNGLMKSSYYYWHKRLRLINGTPGFVPVFVNPKLSGSIEVTYPNGVCISYSGELNATSIKALVCCI